MVFSALRRHALGAFLFVALTLSLTGCSSDNDKDKESNDAGVQLKADSSSYFVGEVAKLTATFPKGTGRIEPGDIAVTSGQTITTPVLTTNIRYVLKVTDEGKTETRNLDLTVKYRERVRSIAAPFARSEHAAVRLPDGRVAIFGGEDGGHALPHEIYVFDSQHESFEKFGELSSGRVAFTAIALYSGDILVYGGISGLTSSPLAEIIDGETGEVTTPVNQPPLKRLYAAASKLMDGRVLISGGAATGQPYSRSVELYDPETQTFTMLPGGLNVGRIDHTMVRIDDRKFLVYGGTTLDNTPAPPELYDPATGNSTTLTAPENLGRYSHVAHTMRDGTIWILGGEDFDGQPLTSVQRFDPATLQFLQSFNLATPRSSAAIARLADARVLILGGQSSAAAASATETTELLTAPTERRDGPRMSVKRKLHTATPLDNGKVLIFGGLDERQQVLSSAEIFE